MKKFFLIISLSCMSVMFLNAQHVNFGIKGGLNLATVNYENEDYDNKAGFHAGVLAHIHINNQFAIQPELVFSQQGGDGTAHKFNANYLNMPVLAQYMFGNGWRLQTGPQLGILLNAEREADNGVEVDVNNRIKTVDFAWTLGGGYMFPGGLGIDARYNYGLSNINEPSEQVKGENRVIQIGLFYQFGHKNKAVKK